MKRILHTAVASFIFLTTCSLVGYFSYYLEVTDFWVMFGIATATFAVGLCWGFIKKRWCKIVAFFINAVAMGLYLQSWYINRGFHNSVWLMLGVALLAVAYLVLYALPLLIPAVNRHYSAYLITFVLLSLGGYVALLILTKTTWVSTLGFYGILQLSFIVGCSFSCKDFDDEIHALWISSCSLVICAIIILLVVLGGDGCDCGDGCGGGDFDSPVKQRGKNVKTPENPIPPTDVGNDL